MPSISTQRLVVRALLSLPSSLLRLLSGGGVVYRGGRTLDPRLQFLAAGAARGPALTTMSPEEARELLAAFPGVAVLCYHGVRADAWPPGTIPFEPLHVRAAELEGHCRLIREKQKKMRSLWQEERMAMNC